MAQRVDQIAAGHEDCSDADDLRPGPVLRTVVGRLPQIGHDLASGPTLSRFVSRVARRELGAMAQILLDQFLTRLKPPAHPDPLPA